MRSINMSGTPVLRSAFHKVVRGLNIEDKILVRDELIITACVVATSSCISDVSCQWEGAMFDHM